MTANAPAIAGIGSVTPYGVFAGPIVLGPLEPRPITAWPVAGVRRAYLVEPFRATDVVPGLKTRRLDRLSVWSLVAASLAVKDTGLDLGQVDRSRVAVVFATGLGCIELTEAFFRSAANHGWQGTDPILFPETLGNAPASHVARCLDLRGPNITVGSKGRAAECALLHAASLLRHGQADLALVLAGDTLTRTSYEWYESAGWLADDSGFIPSEGVTAVVLTAERTAHSYATLSPGQFASSPEPVSRGLGDAGGLLRLVLSLSPVKGPASLPTELP
jgi:3-oxoacyl-[acyl-carrier-protein] synthase II